MDGKSLGATGNAGISSRLPMESPRVRPNSGSGGATAPERSRDRPAKRVRFASPDTGDAAVGPGGRVDHAPQGGEDAGLVDQIVLTGVSMSTLPTTETRGGTPRELPDDSFDNGAEHHEHSDEAGSVDDERAVAADEQEEEEDSTFVVELLCDANVDDGAAETENHMPGPIPRLSDEDELDRHRLELGSDAEAEDGSSGDEMQEAWLCECLEECSVGEALPKSRFAGLTYLSCSRARGKKTDLPRCQYWALVCECPAVVCSSRQQIGGHVYEVFECSRCQFYFLDPNPVPHKFL